MESTNNSRQALWVGIGQFFAYAIGIVSPMILSRYFDKCDYGTYKQVMYVYNTLLTVFAFGLPRAYSYFIPRVSLGESKDVINKISKIFIILGLSFSLLLFFGSETISILLNNPDLAIALRYFSPTPVFLLPVMGLDCILASYKNTKLIALYTISTKIFTLLCIILPVIICNGSYVHAIIGFDIASFLSFVLALYLRSQPTRGIPLERTSIKYREIFSYTLPLVVASLWIMIFQSSNQFFISRWYGNETFADFSNGFIDFPIIPMILSSVATVLLPLFSGMVQQNKQKINEVCISAISKSVKLTYPITVYCVVFAELIMICFYGIQYESSAPYFIVKSIEGFFMIMPFYPIILALGKTKIYSIIHLVMAFILVLLDCLIVSINLPPIMIGIAYVICSVAKIILQFIVVSKCIGIKALEFIPIKMILLITMCSFASSILPFMVLKQLEIINHFAQLACTLIMYMISYYMFCWICGISYKEVLEPIIPYPKVKFLINKLVP